MSDTNNFETGYQDDDNTVGPDNTGTGSDNGNAPTSRAKPAGKKGSKVPLIIFGVLAVLGIGAGAWFMLGGSAPPAPARPPVVTPAADPAADQTAADQTAADQKAGQDAPANSQNPQVDPITGLPVSDPAQAAPTTVDPMTGLPVSDPAQAAPTAVDPMTGPPMSDPAQAAPTAVDPITGLPVSDPAQTQPTGDKTGAQSIDPITGLPVSDPAQVSPAPVAQPVQQPAPVASGDPLAQFRDMLAPIDSRVTNLEGQVSTLTSRVDDISKQVDRLADRPRNNSVNASSAPAPRRRAASTARKPAASNNYVRVSDSLRVPPPVSRVVIVSQGSTAHQALLAGASPESIIQQAQPASHTASVRSVSVADSQPDAAPAHSCNLQAIVPGRVWVKNPDGSFSSYGEGETWNGQIVGTIDPARGVKLGNRWVCN